jgi:nicotinamidase-related amidase
MTSEPRRDPRNDHLLTPENCAFIVIDHQPVQVGSIRSMDQRELVFNIVHTAKAAVNYGLPIIHSTGNVATGRNRPAIEPLMEVLRSYPPYDRTSINSWEDVEFKKAVVASGRKKLIMTALWTEACLTLDALEEDYEVYPVVDAVGGTSVRAHEAALRRIEQAGAKLISKTQLYCELQRDWNRTETVPGFMEVFKNWDAASPDLRVV